MHCQAVSDDMCNGRNARNVMLQMREEPGDEEVSNGTCNIFLRSAIYKDGTVFLHHLLP